MKKLFLCVAVTAVMVLSGCNKEKICTCTSVTKFTGVGADLMDDMTTTTTATIDKGDCSDLSSSSTSSLMGMTTTTTVTCK